ncbi:hypothetical protein BKA81DRAFT_96440 [Phyllosticta paracitricarpa]
MLPINPKSSRVPIKPPSFHPGQCRYAASPAATGLLNSSCLPSSRAIQERKEGGKKKGKKGNKREGRGKMSKALAARIMRSECVRPSTRPRSWPVISRPGIRMVGRFVCTWWGVGMGYLIHALSPATTTTCRHSSACLYERPVPLFLQTPGRPIIDCIPRKVVEISTSGELKQAGGLYASLCSLSLAVGRAKPTRDCSR